MSLRVIDADGDYFLDTAQNPQVRQSEATTVMILENSASATLVFGLADEDDDFVAFPNGEIENGNVIHHGKGARLMVRVSGINTGTATIRLLAH